MKKLIMYGIMFLVMILGVFAVTIDNREFDLLNEQYGLDSWNTKVMKSPTDDSGFVLGTGGDILTANFGQIQGMADADKIACAFQSESYQDIIYDNGNDLMFISSLTGIRYGNFTFPDSRSPLTCYDIDGDGLGEVIGMNFQGGEVVIQIIDYDIATDTIVQFVAYAMADFGGMNQAGPIRCNDLGDDSRIRCFIQGYDSSADTSSVVVSLVVNVSDSNVYVSDNVTLTTNQTWIIMPRFQRVEGYFGTGDTKQFYAWWGDTISKLNYDFSLEDITVTNTHTYGDMITDAIILTDLKRGSQREPNTNKYKDNIAVWHRGSNLTIFDSSLNVKREQIAIWRYFDSALTTTGNYITDKMFAYDYYGDGYKDIYISGYTNTGCPTGYPLYFNVFDLEPSVDNTHMNISSVTSFSTGLVLPKSVICGGVGDFTNSYTGASGKQIDDYTILDIDGDGTEELTISHSDDASAGHSSSNFWNEFYYFDITDPVGVKGEYFTLSAPQSSRYSTFGDFNLDGNIDLFTTGASGISTKIYWHSDTVNPTFMETVRYNDTNNECGFNPNNEDNNCERTINNVTFYTVDVIGGASTLYMSYDCYDEYLPTPTAWVEYNDSSKTFNCTYSVIGEGVTNVHITDTPTTWDLGDIYSTFVNITYEDGTQCNNNNICEVGEDIYNCLSDCANQTSTCDFDNVCEPPAENVFTCPFDCELNQCEDGIDNDADGLTDYPDDDGCESASDDIEFLAVEPSSAKTYTSSFSWWEQYQSYGFNLGYNHYGTNFLTLFWDGSVTVSSKNLGENMNQQALIFDADGTLDNNIMMVDTNTIHFFNATGGIEAEIAPADLGLSSFTLSSQPIAHKVDNLVYIMFVDSFNELIVFTYDDGEVTLLFELVDIIGLSTSGIKCEFNTPTCWIINELNEIDEIDLESGTLTTYSSGVSVLGHTRNIYTEPALDGSRLAWTWYDDTTDKAGVAVFDVSLKTMDTSYDVDGVKNVCVGNSGYTDLDLVISNPVFYNVDGQAKKEIITTCAVYETVGGVHFARASIDVTKSTGAIKWFDILLSDDADDTLTFDETATYMNSSSSNRYLILEQPVIVEEVDGNILVCTRVQQLTGASFEFNRGEYACYQVNSDVVGTMKYGGVCGNTGNLSSCNYTDDIFSGLCTGATCYKLNTPTVGDLFSGNGDELVNYYGVWNVSSGYTTLLFNFTDFGADAHTSIGDTNSDNILDVVISSDNDFGFLYYTTYANQLPTFTNLLWDTCSPICRFHNITYEATYEDFEGDQIVMRVDCIGNGEFTNWSEPSYSPTVSCLQNAGGVYTAIIEVSDPYNRPLGNVVTFNHEVEVRSSGCFESGQNDGVCCTSGLCEDISTATSTGFDKFGFNASIGTDATTPDNYQSTNYDFSKCEDWTGFLFYWLWFCPPYYVFMGGLKTIALWMFSNFVLILGLTTLLVIIKILFKKR